ncbi:MAG: FHA domain-containing protein [Gemmatimonadales bacterium]
MILVEVLGRRGDVVQRVRLERLPATIGRGYECDVILSDPLVDARHARLVLDEQGRTVLEDLGSRNGLFKGGVRGRVSRAPVDGVTTARIGRTLLRIVPDGAAVPPALPDTDSGDRLAVLLASPRWNAVVLIAGFAATTLWLWLGGTEARAASVAGGETLGVVILSATWAGFWALIGRANVQRFSFWPHLTLTWLFLVLLGVVGGTAGYAEFLFPDAPLDAVAMFAALVLAAALFARHLGLATLLSRRRRNLVAAATAAAVLLLVLFAGRIAGDEAEDATVALSVSVKPLPARLVPATGLEAFVRKSDGLKREIDGLKDAN